jgi:hypothetical protein
MNEGLNVIQPVIYDYYKNIYPDWYFFVLNVDQNNWHNFR